jgi:hypothetical protein
LQILVDINTKQKRPTLLLAFLLNFTGDFDKKQGEYLAHNLQIYHRASLKGRKFAPNITYKSNLMPCAKGRSRPKLMVLVWRRM